MIKINKKEWKFVGNWNQAFGWKCPLCGKIFYSPSVEHKGCSFKN